MTRLAGRSCGGSCGCGPGGRSPWQSPAIGEGIRELSARMDAEDARRAEAQRAMNEPAVWQQPEYQAQAEATLEPSWEPGEAMADMDFEAEI